MAEQHNGHTHDHDHAHGCGTVGVNPNMVKYDAIDLVVSADIIAKAKELAEMIGNTEEVRFYQQAEKQVQGNEEVQSLIKLIKKRQKEAVAFESFENRKMVDKINGEIDELQDQLDAFPIVGQFKQAQEDINYVLQLVVSVIRDTVSEKVQVEAGKVETSNCSD